MSCVAQTRPCLAGLSLFWVRLRWKPTDKVGGVGMAART